MGEEGGWAAAGGEAEGGEKGELVSGTCRLAVRRRGAASKWTRAAFIVRRRWRRGHCLGAASKARRRGVRRGGGGLVRVRACGWRGGDSHARK